MQTSERALTRADFLRVVALNAALDVIVPGPERRAALASIAESTQELLADGPRALARGIPLAIGRAMQPYGWFWNGFYAPRADGNLHLGPACGPPVCSPLEARGGALTSGMCFDGLHLNQTLAAYDTGNWPGYVSCDGASGGTTRGGIVVPVRDARGSPIAVWDLDASEAIQPGDVRFMDVLFGTLSRCIDFASSDFEDPAAGS